MRLKSGTTHQHDVPAWVPDGPGNLDEMSDGVLEEDQVHGRPAHHLVVLLLEEVQPVGEDLNAGDGLVDLGQLRLPVALLLPGGLGGVPHEVHKVPRLLDGCQAFWTYLRLDQTQKLSVEPLLVYVRHKPGQMLI